MSFDEVADKFRECAEYGNWPVGRTEDVIAMVQGLESVDDAALLAALFASGR